MNCQGKDCKNGAVCAPIINIPATGFALDKHTPLECITSLRLCLECFGRLKIADFLTEEFRHVVLIQLKGRVPPDFKRSFFTKMEDFQSPEWLALTTERN